MFWPDKKLHPCLVDGVPSVDNSQRSTKKCNCEGNGLNDSHCGSNPKAFQINAAVAIQKVINDIR